MIDFKTLNKVEMINCRKNVFLFIFAVHLTNLWSVKIDLKTSQDSVILRRVEYNVLEEASLDNKIYSDVTQVQWIEKVNISY